MSAVRDERASRPRKLVHPRGDDLVPLRRRRRRALRVPQDGDPVGRRESMTPGILLAASLSMPRDVSTYGDKISWLIDVTNVFCAILFIIMCIWMGLAF